MIAEQLAFDGPGRAIYPAVVMTAHHGRNAAMIAAVARLYIPDGATVLDVTWGKGNFWTRTDTSRFRLIGADLASPHAQIRADFRALPFADATLDVAVLDPPYIHAPGRRPYIEQRYRNRETTAGLGTWKAVMGLYWQGIKEAHRVLRPGGTCWVKCQDSIESHQLRPSSVKVHQLGKLAGFEAQDLFVLTTDTPPGGGRAVQHHARRNHSYLWIFRKRRTA